MEAHPQAWGAAALQTKLTEQPEWKGVEGGLYESIAMQQLLEINERNEGRYIILFDKQGNLGSFCNARAGWTLHEFNKEMMKIKVMNMSDAPTALENLRAHMVACMRNG